MAALGITNPAEKPKHKTGGQFIVDILDKPQDGLQLKSSIYCPCQAVGWWES